MTHTVYLDISATAFLCHSKGIIKNINNGHCSYANNNVNMQYNTSSTHFCFGVDEEVLRFLLMGQWGIPKMAALEDQKQSGDYR